MKERQQFFLQFRGQVDQKIAADDEIEPGKGGVHDDVLGGEGHHRPDLLADPVGLPILDKEALEAFGGDVGDDVGRVAPEAGLGDGVRVEVGGKDLQY